MGPSPGLRLDCTSLLQGGSREAPTREAAPAVLVADILLPTSVSYMSVCENAYTCLYGVCIRTHTNIMYILRINVYLTHLDIYFSYMSYICVYNICICIWMYIYTCIFNT